MSISGTIFLYYNTEIVRVHRYDSKKRRQQIIETWKKEYRFWKSNGLIWIQISPDINLIAIKRKIILELT